jgi:hypothetical protein
MYDIPNQAAPYHILVDFISGQTHGWFHEMEVQVLYSQNYMFEWNAVTPIFNICSFNILTTQLTVNFLTLEVGDVLPFSRGNSELLLNYTLIFVMRYDINDTNIDGEFGRLQVQISG